MADAICPVCWTVPCACACSCGCGGSGGCGPRYGGLGQAIDAGGGSSVGGSSSSLVEGYSAQQIAEIADISTQVASRFVTNPYERLAKARAALQSAILEGRPPRTILAAQESVRAAEAFVRDYQIQQAARGEWTDILRIGAGLFVVAAVVSLLRQAKSLR